mmetsp:Transcript_24702/g.82857  ORF Transcript_24702/g.82857 Transcript_24702/m.82857 type:complete len:251 (-) Transcript_24702:1077-1829(-)
MGSAWSAPRAWASATWASASRPWGGRATRCSAPFSSTPRWPRAWPSARGAPSCRRGRRTRNARSIAGSGQTARWRWSTSWASTGCPTGPVCSSAAGRDRATSSSPPPPRPCAPRRWARVASPRRGRCAPRKAATGRRRTGATASACARRMGRCPASTRTPGAPGTTAARARCSSWPPAMTPTRGPCGAACSGSPPTPWPRPRSSSAASSRPGAPPSFPGAGRRRLSRRPWSTWTRTRAGLLTRLGASSSR